MASKVSILRMRFHDSKKNSFILAARLKLRWLLKNERLKKPSRIGVVKSDYWLQGHQFNPHWDGCMKY